MVNSSVATKLSLWHKASLASRAGTVQTAKRAQISALSENFGYVTSMRP